MAQPQYQEYQLRAELRGHEEDVRGLCVVEADLVTSSRDKTIKLWKESGPLAFEETSTLVGHKDYVGPLAYIARGASPLWYPDGALISGSRDAKVIVWDLGKAAVLKTLEGHRYQVSDVAVGLDGSVVSSSLDGTIRVWGNDGAVQELKGHDGAVLCVMVLPDGNILSGGGDKTVKLWAGGECIHTFTGHTDTVRGLTLLPGVGVVTASHDQSLRAWTFSGECTAELLGHTALVYAAAVSPDGLIASAGEDNTARLWRPDGTLLQTLQHPGCVWDVAFLPNGDLVTACADHVARVWSPASERQQPAEVIEAFDAAMQARAAASTSHGGESGGLPAGLTIEDPSVLLAPGARDGQTKIVRENGVGMAYGWSTASGQWEKIGEVVGGPSSGGEDNMGVGTKFYNGQMYDFVFDVDWEDGMPPKKLALNRGDNPYDVADSFLERENLPSTYREQVVKFIVQNSAGGVAMPPVPASNADPFTGTGAYIPGASSFPVPGTSGGHHVTGGGVDPFTGSSQSARPHLIHVPATTFTTFASMPSVEGAARKVREFSALLASSPDTSPLALSEGEAASGGGIDQLLLRAAGAASSSAGGTLLDAGDVQLLAKLLQWPPAQLFPALDIARLLALNEESASLLASTAGTLSEFAPGSLSAAVAHALQPPQQPPTLQTALRLASNAFAHAPLRAWVQAQRPELLGAAAPCLASSVKGVQQGIATLLLNYAIQYAGPYKGDAEGKTHVLTAAVELLRSQQGLDIESTFRALLALGTLAHCDKQIAALARDLGASQAVQQLKQSSSSNKVVEAAMDVITVLQS